MKTDAEVQIMLRERRKGKTQQQAAARAGMHPNTARKYEQRGALPSQLKEPRTYRTRPNPFEADWPWVQAQLERDLARARITDFADATTDQVSVGTVVDLRDVTVDQLQGFDAVVHMAGLPLEANVLFMTVMATKMPFVGRG